ncbi:Forkhead transcription factor, partial [Elasticomyces elasticus]
MASTRQAPPIQIYQDYTEPQYTPEPMPPQRRPRPQLAPSAMPLQPTNYVQQYRQPAHIVMKPPGPAPQQISPLKSQHFIPPEHNYSPLNMIPNLGFPEIAPIYHGSPAKSMTLPSSQPMPLAPHMPMQPMYSTFDSNFNQENYAPHIPMSSHDSYVDFPDPASVRRQPLKRSYSDVTGTQGGQLKRMKMDDGDLTEMPHPDDIIRHNLSLNKAFKKQERPKGDAGKGSYWVIVPGQEAQFFKEKSKRTNTVNLNIQQYGQQPTMHIHPAPATQALAPNPWTMQPNREPLPDLLPPRPQTAPALPELSSDATVPASDPALAEEPDHDVFRSKPIPELAPPIAFPPPSSPPMLNSSPPIMRSINNHNRKASSPAHLAGQTSRKHRRNLTGMDDSGYYSSLDSSIRRPKAGAMPPSELGTDRPHMKLGRAEEELVRLRSSSHDLTPSHNRYKNVSSEAVQPTSPVQNSPDMFKLNPMTPAVVFKKPLPPPQSISPNTQLRKHREAMAQLIGSPAKTDDVFGFTNESPAHRMTHSFDDSFLSMFEAGQTNLFSSPLKGPASMKKGSIALKTNVLGDITSK